MKTGGRVLGTGTQTEAARIHSKPSTKRVTQKQRVLPVGIVRAAAEDRGKPNVRTALAVTADRANARPIPQSAMKTQTTIAVFDLADHTPALRNVQGKKDHNRIRMLRIGAAHTIGITVGIADIIVGKKQDISGSVQQRNVAVDADAPRVRGDHAQRAPSV